MGIYALCSQHSFDSWKSKLSMNKCHLPFSFYFLFSFEGVPYISYYFGNSYGNYFHPMSVHFYQNCPVAFTDIFSFLRFFAHLISMAGYVTMLPCLKYLEKCKNKIKTDYQKKCTLGSNNRKTTKKYPFQHLLSLMSKTPPTNFLLNFNLSSI